MVESNSYYKKFSYLIEKKFTVEDDPKIKDLCLKNIYIYIILDPEDKNRFVYLSTNNLKEKSVVHSETFKLVRISSMKESILLSKKTTPLNNQVLNLVKKSPEESKNKEEHPKKENKSNKQKYVPILIHSISEKKVPIYKKYRTHSHKIALDEPEWYLSKLKSYQVVNLKKRFLKEILCSNIYNKEIEEHFISTLFLLKNNDLQKFNDHSLILDQGKTGKSSLVGHIAEKVDNISIAGLYGSSDSKSGTFQGGLISLTKKSIIVDEINELSKNTKNEKILSVLNTMLENGQYNYVKQHSGKITGCNQFIFMGNIGINYNLPMMLETLVGNNQTLGRRIGIVTYNPSLEGFEKGFIRPNKISPFTNAMSEYCSQIFNSLINDKKFLSKLTTHQKYKALESYYKFEVQKLERKTENEICIDFFRSHKEAIDRIVFRALKLYIFEKINDFFSKERDIFNRHIVFEVLEKALFVAKQNVSNLENIVDHVNNSEVVSRKPEINKFNFNLLSKRSQEMVKLIYLNHQDITPKGETYNNLKFKGESRRQAHRIKSEGISTKLKNQLLEYGIKIEKESNCIKFYLLNKNLFLSKTEFIFDMEIETSV